MKIIGVVWLRAIKYCCSLTPLIPGICTSATKQDVSCNRGDSRYSCADANACTTNPVDLSKRTIAVRNEVSSSTTDIIAPSTNRCGETRREKRFITCTYFAWLNCAGYLKAVVERS